MTDNRSTELLREGLTEHGIEWRSGLKGVTFVGDWCFVEYDNGKLAATCEPVLTPEQAIAATLGSDAKFCYATDYTHGRCKYSVNRGWTEDTKFYVPTLRHGTLTAEQVSKAVYEHSIHADCADADWQAIADELNATLDGGEGDGLPSVEWGRIVTGLIAAHYDNDEERFRERAVKAAKMYDERGKYEVAEYITAQYCPSTAFVPM